MSYIGNTPTQVAFVTDTFSGNGSTTAFTMSVAPAGTSSVLVAVTGVLQDPSTYSVVGTTLTFSAAPPTGTGNISVRYLGIPASGVTTTAYRTVTEFTATSGQTTFTPPSYTVGFINVYRNGVLLGSADYTATNGTTVVLAAGATSGDTVTIESFYVSSVLNAIPATAGAVNSTYIASGAVGTTQQADASVTQAKLAANVAGNGPAFSYTKSSTQTVSNNTWTKVTWSTLGFDTNSNFDAANNRFKPTVAGYYQVNLVLDFGGPTITFAYGAIYKNGGIVIQGAGIGASTNEIVSSTSYLVYLNGSTDYIEAYGLVNTSGTPMFYGGGATGFQASMVRAA